MEQKNKFWYEINGLDKLLFRFQLFVDQIVTRQEAIVILQEDAHADWDGLDLCVGHVNLYQVAKTDIATSH